MARRSLRQSPAAMFWISTMAIIGMSLNRVNVAGLATLTATKGSYFPIWPEWAMTAGILSLATLAFLSCVEHFRIFDAIDGEAVDRAYRTGTINPANWRTIFFHNPLSSARLYSAAVVLAFGLATFCLPQHAVHGVKPEKTPTRAPRAVTFQKVKGAPGAVSRFIFPVARSGESASAVPPSQALLLDGDDNGRFVLFEHKGHIERLKSEGQECGACHHMNKPLAQATSCHQCHADMYLARDIFSHRGHVKHLGDKEACIKCHTDPALPKVERNTTPCASCHPEMRAKESLIATPITAGRTPGHKAPGYRAAMHKLCIDCHKKNEDQIKGLAGCTTCHRDLPNLTSMSRVESGRPPGEEAGR
jgi:hypothetical protein